MAACRRWPTTAAIRSRWRSSRMPTRYYQIYDAGSGRLLVQSAALAPLGLHYTPGEVQAFRREPGGLSTCRPTRRGSGCRAACCAGGRGRPTCCRSAYRSTPDGRRAPACSCGCCSWSVPAGLLVRVVRRALDGRAGAGAAGAARRRPRERSASPACERRLAGARRRRRARRGRGRVQRPCSRGWSSAVGEMRQFSAAMAHELRTPLAALRGEARAGADAGVRAGGRSSPTGGQPARRSRQADAAGRAAADAGARRGRRDAGRRGAGGPRRRWPRRSSSSSNRWRRRRTSRCRASVGRCDRDRRRCGMARAAAAQPPRQRDQVHAAAAAR